MAYPRLVHLKVTEFDLYSGSYWDAFLRWLIVTLPPPFRIPTLLLCLCRLLRKLRPVEPCPYGMIHCKNPRRIARIHQYVRHEFIDIRQREPRLRQVVSSAQPGVIYQITVAPPSRW